MSNNNKPEGPSGKLPTANTPVKGARTPAQNMDGIKNKDALQDVKVPKTSTAPKAK